MNTILIFILGIIIGVVIGFKIGRWCANKYAITELSKITSKHSRSR